MVNSVICLGHFCEVHGPSLIECTQHVNSLKDNMLAKDESPHCVLCRLSFPNNMSNIVSKDSENADDEIVPGYISCSYPTLPRRYASLTKLLMKALSAEMNSDLSKPLFYGDEVSGYCLNRIFKIKDNSARGGERKYCLLYISDNEKKVLQNWDIIDVYQSTFISSVKEKVARADSQLSAGDNVLNSENYLRRQLNAPKSLMTLTNDKLIFVQFHSWACSLLADTR